MAYSVFEVQMPNFHKVLIANRGEIACRIARTCRQRGLAVATIHSSADRQAKHVREIGESIEVGGPEAKDSYLNIEAIIAAAQYVGADAIHPGYGFLSEQPSFVMAVEAAGLVFIGPRAETMERLGSKSGAKIEAAKLGLPILLGSENAMKNSAEVASLIKTMTLPVILKAVAGGGGRGMAIIENLEGLENRISSAMREAEKSFGLGDLIVEPYLKNVRHIEVQILGDGHGNVLHLFDRECTLQRRHQKIIEEAPASGLSQDLRQSMWDDAVKLASSVKYRGLGTVEFIVQDRRYFFLEVNPRLQVEHPVTESVLNLDLVDLQLHIAIYNSLPFDQTSIKCNGNSFEARLCAEDTNLGFLPSTGVLSLVDFSQSDLRIDTGFDTGDSISPYYDSMIAKLISHGENRDIARQALINGLSQTIILGLPTNINFLKDLLQFPSTCDFTFHTRLIDEWIANKLLENIDIEIPIPHICAAAFYWLEQERTSSKENELWNTWKGFTGWRLNSSKFYTTKFSTILVRDASENSINPLEVEENKNIREIQFGSVSGSGNTTLYINGKYYQIKLDKIGTHNFMISCDQSIYEIFIIQNNNKIELSSSLGHNLLEIVPYLSVISEDAGHVKTMQAQMMGKIVSVNKAIGSQVKKGETLVMIESMKMELHVKALFDGTLEEILCKVGDMVERHQILAIMEPN